MANSQQSSLLQYLPAIYRDREEPFLGDFLLAFEQLLFGLDDGARATGAPPALEQTIAGIASYFDPEQTPSNFLSWLASWTAFSLRADLTSQKQREFLANIISLYRYRGTKKNLVDLLTIFSITPTVTEEMADPPHRFTVTLTLPRALPDAQLRQIGIARALVELEKPAHTDFDLKPHFAGMQIEEFSTVGVDTQIGSAQTR